MPSYAKSLTTKLDNVASKRHALASFHMPVGTTTHCSIKRSESNLLLSTQVARTQDLFSRREMAFTKIENLHVPVGSDVVISCNVFLPGFHELDTSNTPEKQIKSIDFGAEKLDVIFEYVPYRKNDLIYGRDYSRHGYFAQQGFVSVRGDMRGTGDSNGLPDPSKDAADGWLVLEYFAKFQFTSGKSFLFGLSWGGSVALEIAAKYPESVNGVIAMCSNGDRETAINFTQGCLIASELVTFSNMMLARTALPMVRNYSEDLWLERLENMRPHILHDRLNQQNRRPMRDHFDTTNARNATCPVLLITGFRDYARNGVFDLADEQFGLNSQSKVILGPWAHNFPDIALPNLNFDLMGIAKMWFQRDPQLSKLPRLSVYCENDTTWYTITGRITLILEIQPTDQTFPMVLKPTHVGQGLYNGAWFTKGIHDDPGDQAFSNQLSDSFALDRKLVEEGTIICGIVKVNLSIQEPPEKFYIGAALCQKNDSKILQIASGYKYAEKVSEIILELGACCYCVGSEPLTVNLRTSGFPVLPSFTTNAAITIAKMSVELPTLDFTDGAGSPILLRPASAMPQCSLKVVKKPEFSRDINIALGGSLPDTISVKRVSTLGSGYQGSIGYSDAGSDTAKVTFDLSKPSQYSAERTYSLEHGGQRFQTTAHTKAVIKDDEIETDASLEAFVDGRRIFSGAWQRIFARRS